MEYDDTDKGSLFMPFHDSNNEPTVKLTLVGKVNDQGEEERHIMTMETLPSGDIVRNIYKKVGTLYENDNDNERAPQYTGPYMHRRASYWQKETKDGAPYFSLSLQDKKGSGDIAPPQQAAISQQTQEDDSKIPF